MSDIPTKEEYYSQLYNACKHEWEAYGLNSFCCPKCYMCCRIEEDCINFGVPVHMEYEVVYGLPRV